MIPNQGFVERFRYRVNLLEHKVLQYRLSTNETVVADTEYGKIKGIKRKTIYDDTYYSFEGIPYAEPPLGELRFKAPQKPKPWDDVKDCTQAKDKAVQEHVIFNKIEGSEDCLYLNVYTNNIKPETPRPVLVWVHGGGFIIGEANREYYGPDYFMRKDVVFVNIQYRLGALGFLSLNSTSLEVPGNAGLKDQVLALKWVKENIANFGGNADCITVFGESAGGASTHYLMLTDKTEGLFHRGILMSGNALTPWAMTDCRKRAFELAKLAGYKGENDENDILEFLKKAKAKDLINLQEKTLTLDEINKHTMFAFGPTVEPYVTADTLISKHPKELQKTAWSNKIPILVGNTSYEGLVFVPAAKQQQSQLLKELETCTKYVPAEIIGDERDSAEALELGAKIKRAHVNGESPTFDNLLDVLSHLHFLFPIHRLLQLRLKYAPEGGSIYLYRFDFDSEKLINQYRIMRFGRGVKGVSHADELSYLFTTALSRRQDKNSREYRTLERVIDIWTQFAITGNPYNENIDGLKALTWEPLQKTDQIYKCLNINDNLEVIDLPEMEKIKLWESCYEKHAELFP